MVGSTGNDAEKYSSQMGWAILIGCTLFWFMVVGLFALWYTHYKTLANFMAEITTPVNIGTFMVVVFFAMLPAAGYLTYLAADGALRQLQRR